MRMNAADHKRVSDAVGRAEADTDGEIVTIVAARSDHYHDVLIGIALLLGALTLLGTIATPDTLTNAVYGVTGGWRDASAPAAPAMEAWFGVALATLVFVVTVAVLMATPLGDRVVPRGIREQRVAERALDYFRVAAQKRTVGLTGIIIYLSLAEHRAEIIADEAIASKVDAGVWGDAMEALLGPVRTGDVAGGMVGAVEEVGRVLTEHFPKSDGNRNELPDRLIEL